VPSDRDIGRGGDRMPDLSAPVDGILLVHGGFHSSACWRPVQDRLSGPSVAVDLPGRGSRPADLTKVTLDDCVAAVLDAADSVGYHRFVLAAHSIGGVTTTETAARYPDRVAHLVYFGALVPAPGQSAAIIMAGNDFPPGAMPMLDEAVARVLFGTGLDDNAWAAYWGAIVPETAAVLNARLSGYPRGIPITYVSMTDDVPVSPQVAQEVVATLRAQSGTMISHVVLDSGHAVMQQCPNDVAELIDAAFLAVGSPASPT
jgi:pimeloyl-ACP methyl ester carboxylesterase